MTVFWPRALLLVVSVLLTTLLLWAVSSPLPAALFAAGALALLMLFTLRQLSRLEYWLNDAENRPAPDAAGIWGDLFARLNRMVRKQVRDRESRIAALHDMEQATSALPEGVVSLDESDHIEWCNPLAELHFGLDNERDAGQQITYLARQPEFVHYLAAKQFASPLILHGTRQDPHMVVSIKLIPYGANKKLLVSRDITQFERVEAMRRDFVANVSHELRTPLTVVNGFVETLSDMPSLENDMARHALQLMSEQTHRMNRLVEDLLTLSTLENELNVLQEEKVDVAQLARILRQEGEALSDGKHTLRLDLNCPCGVLGSGSELHSAFGNLVSNAIRYTPPGGEIVVSWRDLDGHPVFSVQDSGIGIAAQHIPRLTERFYRVDRSRSRETGGTGLGLAIVKHIASRHQAHLEIQSEEGRGSTFSIVFPAKRRAELAAEAQAA